jgi:bifunctional non-homologous end joining protein LigD
VPELVVRVRYKEWRDGGLLRQPAFIDLVGGTRPEACRRPEPIGAEREEPPVPEVVAEEREVQLTNQDKVFWPVEEGHPRAFTKGDLVEYYRGVAPHLLPYLRDRLVVLTRFPDGIYGKSFFQKDAPTWVPDWIRTEVIWSEHAEREIHYVVAGDVESLVFLANLGTIPLHIWSSRLDSLTRPDWTILDLDPKGAPFAHVVRCARAIKKLCDEIELPSYCKTSGSTGLHVLIPLGGQCTFEQGRDLAHLLARVIETEHGDIATTARSIRARDGKVYLDYLQNGHGRLLVAPYSVREKPGAPVSAPLRWSEVNGKLDIGRFTIETMPRRLARMKNDPLLPVLTEKPDLGRALALLGERQEERQ